MRIQRSRVPLRLGLRGPRRPLSFRRGGSPPPPPFVVVRGAGASFARPRPLTRASPGRSRSAVGESPAGAEAGAVPAFRRSSASRPVSARSPRAPAPRSSFWRAGAGRGGRTFARGPEAAAAGEGRAEVAPFVECDADAAPSAPFPLTAARRGRRSIASHSQVPIWTAASCSGLRARAEAPLRGVEPRAFSSPPRPAPSLRVARPLRAGALGRPRAVLPASAGRVRPAPASRWRPSSERSGASRRSARVGMVAERESGIRLWATRSWSERLANAFTRAAGPGASGLGIPPREKGGSLAFAP